jgi:putative endonuclease
MKYYFVYMMSGKSNRAVYTGVTSDLPKRVYQHKNKLFKGFTQVYNLDKLIYYEVFESSEEAIKREKQIKGGSRKKKDKMINKMNPRWEDLYDKL